MILHEADAVPNVQDTRIPRSPAVSRVSTSRSATPRSVIHLTTAVKPPNELRKAPLVTVTNRTVAIGIDPFGILSPQIVAQSYPQLSVRHDRLRSHGAVYRCFYTRLRQSRAHDESFRLPMTVRHSASVRFVSATSELVPAPSFGRLPHC